MRDRMQAQDRIIQQPIKIRIKIKKGRAQTSGQAGLGMGRGVDGRDLAQPRPPDSGIGEVFWMGGEPVVSRSW